MASLALKASVAGGAALATVFGIGMIVLVGQVGVTIGQQTEAVQKSAAIAEANAVRSRLDAAERIAETLVSVMGSMKSAGVTERAAYEPVLRDSLARYPEVLATWVSFEANALDGKDAEFAGKAGHDATGRFIPYWSQGDGSVRREELKDYATDGAGDYYLQPFRQKRPMAIEPYMYPVGGKSTLIMSFAAPIVIEGRVLGVGGIDITLDALNAELGAVKPFGDGYVALMSGTGLTVAHPNAEASGKPLADFDATAADAAQRAISTGKSTETDGAGRDGAAWRYVAEPIKAGGTNEVWAVVTAAPVATLTAPVDQTRWTMIALSAICVLIVGLILFGLLKLIVDRSLRSLGATVSRMASGDYEIDVPEASRNDDVGLIGQAVVTFRDGLKARAAEDAAREADAAAGHASERKRNMADFAGRFETAIGGIVSLVSSAATELEATATELTSTARAAAAQSSVVSEAAAEGSQSVNIVADAAEQLGAAVAEISQQVTRSAGLSTHAVTEAAASSKVMGELSTAASRIGDIVALISEIASQTNLLALNATIEAARAGEAGRGFAVVASEVKNLAEQTTRAIGDISAQIAAIQNSTGRAVTAIAGIGATIGSVNEATVAMSAAIEEQNASSQEIVSAAHRAASGTAAITANISGVAKSAEDTEATAGQVLGAASELSNHAERLRAEVDGFLATIRAA